jgi:hypothetical protein
LDNGNLRYISTTKNYLKIKNYQNYNKNKRDFWRFDMEKECWEKLEISIPCSLENGSIYGCPFAFENNFA